MQVENLKRAPKEASDWREETEGHLRCRRRLLRQTAKRVKVMIDTVLYTVVQWRQWVRFWRSLRLVRVKTVRFEAEK